MKFSSKRKSVIAMLLALMWMFGSMTVYADSFPEPEPFEMVSDDGTMVFRWVPGPKDSYSATAQAGVYRNDEQVYSVENLPTYGASAHEYLFSTDFKYLVFKPTTDQVTALGFFENGVLLRSYRIDKLVRDMNVVSYSVSTASWENWRGRVFDADNNTLTIVTLDDITYVFDITTGEIIYDTAGDAPFIPLSPDRYLGTYEASPLWAQDPNEASTEDAPPTPTQYTESADLSPEPFVSNSEETQDLTLSPFLSPDTGISAVPPQDETLSAAPQIPRWRSPLVVGLASIVAAIAVILFLRSRADKGRR